MLIFFYVPSNLVPNNNCGYNNVNQDIIIVLTRTTDDNMVVNLDLFGFVNLGDGQVSG